MSILDTIVNGIKSAVSTVEHFAGVLGQDLMDGLTYVVSNTTQKNLTSDVNAWIGKYIKSLGATGPVAIGMIAFVGDVVEVVETEGADENADSDAIKKLANSPEMIQKIAKVSTAMAKKVVENTAEGGKPLGGWKVWAVIVFAVHAVEMALMIGISGIRTFVSDPAFLGQRWNTAVDAIGLHWLAFAQKPVFRSIGTFSTNDTQALFNYYKSLGATFIINDAQKQQTIYNEADFMDELSFVYTQQLAKGAATDKKTLTALINAKITTTKTPTAVVAAASTAAVPSATTPTKVYSGIIAQGVLQPATSFTPQPKEMIENIDDLTNVLHDNLSRYLAALSGRLRYEVTIVPRVTLPDGTIAVAATQRVIKGYTKAGKAEYKNVLNKYAKVAIYIMENVGRRVKLDEIVLGSTDAIGFQPTLQQLSALNNNVQQNITTQDITQITSVQAPAAAVITTPPTQQPPSESDIQAQLDAIAMKGRPANPHTSTTYEDAQANLVPIRFQTAQMPNGFPVTLLYVGETPNILYNATEISLANAQSLLKSVSPDHLVEINGGVYKSGATPQYQIPGSVQFAPGQWVRIIGLGSFNGTIDDILYNRLPTSKYVWAYQPQRGTLETFVPIDNIPKTP